MRTRSTTTGGFGTANWVRVYSNGHHIGDQALTYTGKQSVKTIQDVVTSGFASLKRCGKFLPLNPVTIETVTEERIPGFWNQTIYYDPNYRIYGPYWGSDVGLTLDVPDPDSSLTDAVVLTAASNSASAQWDVLTFMAELNKTVGTLATIGRHFNSKTGALAATAARYRKDPWGAFRELWLGARYSIRPMILDAVSAARALDALQREYNYVKGTSRQVQEFHDEEYTTTALGGGHQFAPGTQTRYETADVKYSYRGAAYCKVDSAFAAAISFKPEVTAWELVPYSFIVDWFIDVGAWVNTLRPQLKGEFLGVQQSLRTEIKHRVELSWLTDTTGAWYPGGTCNWAYEKTVERYTRMPADIPAPVWSPDITLPKVIDLVALFVGGRTKVHKTLSGRY